MHFVFLCSLFLLFSGMSFAQDLDTLPVFDDLDEALKMPEKVIRLDLSKNKLKEVPDLRQFTNLRELNLSRNKLDSLPDWIVELEKLERLSLDRNKLEHFPNALCELAELQVLVISRNMISWLPECMGQLKELQMLDAWSNEFFRFPDALGTLPKLKVIDVRGINLAPDEARAMMEVVGENVTIHFSPGCGCLD